MSQMLQVRPQISLADLIRAFRQLQPQNREARLAIARTLGFEVIDETLEPEPLKPSKKGSGGKPSRDDRDLTGPPDKASEPVLEDDSEVDQMEPRPFFLESLPPSPTKTIPTEAPATLVAPETDVKRKVLPDPSLFVPRWRRGLLTTALSTRSHDGELDVDRLVQWISEGEPIREVPRMKTDTLRRGLQVLVDDGVGMQPFLLDRDRMLLSLRETLGEDTVHVLRFAESPLKGAGSGFRLSWTDYEPPRRGRPVLALTEFGLSGVSNKLVQDWLTLAERLRRNESRLIVFLPFPRERWPEELAHHLTLIFWERSTSVQDVRRAMMAVG